MANRDTTCQRCGGVGTVCKGSVVNGVCYGCNGTGKRVPRAVNVNRSRGKSHQFAVVNALGQHLAINTDKAVLEALMTNIVNAVGIVEF